MELILDDIVSEELVEFLLTQNGITDVKRTKGDSFIILNIQYNEKTTPEIILKYVEWFQQQKYSMLVGFDKGTVGNFKILTYIVDDLCCEYCYRNFVMDLFEIKKIKSVKSTFDYDKRMFPIEFTIEYDEKYSEEEVLNDFKQKLNVYVGTSDKMIRVNGKEYQNVEYKVTYANYDVFQSGEERKGISPIIHFKCENLFLRLETVYDVTWLEELKENVKTDITNYLSDFSYEDEKGFESFITGKCSCFFTKLENNQILVEATCKYDEYDILIKEIIER